MDVLYVVVFIIAVFISSISQVLLKSATNREYQNRIMEYVNIRVAVAYILFLATTFITIYAYKRIPLSLGSVLETTGYVFITIWGVVLFGERVNKAKLLALGLIILGTIIYSVLG